MNAIKKNIHNIVGVFERYSSEKKLLLREKLCRIHSFSIFNGFEQKSSTGIRF